MPVVLTSDAATPQPYIPIVSSANAPKLGAVSQVFADVAALAAAVAVERSNIANGLPVWADGQAFSVVSEGRHGVIRAWDASAQHARRAILRPGLAVTLGSDTAQVLATSGAPAAGFGAQSDVAVDWAAGLYYTRGLSAWTLTGDVYPSASAGGSVPVPVSASRALTAADDGKVLECTAAGLTLTVPAGLPAGFACAVIPSGTTSIASAGGALLNGATTTLTRSAAGNAMFAVQARAAAGSYVVSGA